MSIERIFASTAALALIAGTPAFAAKSQSEQASATESGAGGDAKAQGERKVCRYIEHTESRMKRERLCFTREQWQKFDEAQ